MLSGLLIPISYAQRADDATNDEYLKEYRDEVRAGRPTLTYAVFEPVILFFKSAYGFVDTVVTVLYEKISSLIKEDPAS